MFLSSLPLAPPATTAVSDSYLSFLCQGRIKIYCIPILLICLSFKSQQGPRVADPVSDSIGSLDPDPDSESGSRRAKMTHKSRQKFVKVHVLKCWMASFES